MRIIRICSNSQSRDLRLKELKEMLVSREYNPKMIDETIKKAKAIPRTKALRPKPSNKQSGRPIMVTPFDPRLPNIPRIQRKHWRSMVNQDRYLSEVFPDPPLVAFTKQKNIRDFTIKAKVPKITHRSGRRSIKGMKKCQKMCAACPFIMEGKQVKNDHFK